MQNSIFIPRASYLGSSETTRTRTLHRLVLAWNPFARLRSEFVILHRLVKPCRVHPRTSGQPPAFSLPASLFCAARLHRPTQDKTTTTTRMELRFQVLSSKISPAIFSVAASPSLGSLLLPFCVSFPPVHPSHRVASQA